MVFSYLSRFFLLIYVVELLWIVTPFPLPLQFVLGLGLLGICAAEITIIIIVVVVVVAVLFYYYSKLQCRHLHNQYQGNKLRETAQRDSTVGTGKNIEVFCHCEKGVFGAKRSVESAVAMLLYLHRSEVAY